MLLRMIGGCEIRSDGVDSRSCWYFEQADLDLDSSQVAFAGPRIKLAESFFNLEVDCVPFPTVFSTLPPLNLKLSSANSCSLEESVICRLGKS